MQILGVSAFYHDSAVALIKDGSILAAAQEERFSRRKHEAGFPTHALNYCLKHCEDNSKIDAVVFYEKPFRKFDRILRTHIANAPRGFDAFAGSIPNWISQKLMQGETLRQSLQQALRNHNWDGTLLYSEHHQSHAASAFFPSPLAEAAILTVDGVGEWTTTSLALGYGNQIRPLKELHFPHSLGLLYSTFCEYLGFRVNSGEYKVMGLAPYGTPRYAQKIFDQVISLKIDGSFKLNQEYFGYTTGYKMTTSRFSDLFGVEAREPEGEITEFHCDLAASIQRVLEDVLLSIGQSIASDGHENLCLSGGVALNVLRILACRRPAFFKRIWVQPAAGDSGGAIGAAWAAYYGHFRQDRKIPETDGMQNCLLGPEFSTEEAERRLKAHGAAVRVLEDEALFDYVADQIARGSIVGWVQGRMEFGPRALGARSILADPRLPNMRERLNSKVKKRELFRPFAPAVLAEHCNEWFDMPGDSPYMLFTANILEHKRFLNDGPQSTIEPFIYSGSVPRRF